MTPSQPAGSAEQPCRVARMMWPSRSNSGSVETLESPGREKLTHAATSKLRYCWLLGGRILFLDKYLFCALNEWKIFSSRFGFGLMFKYQTRHSQISRQKSVVVTRAAVDEPRRIRHGVDVFDQSGRGGGAPWPDRADHVQEHLPHTAYGAQGRLQQDARHDG